MMSQLRAKGATRWQAKRWGTMNGGPVPGSENFLPIRKLSHQRSVHKHKRVSKKEKEGRARMCFIEHKTQVLYKYLLQEQQVGGSRYWQWIFSPPYGIRCTLRSWHDHCKYGNFGKGFPGTAHTAIITSILCRLDYLYIFRASGSI